LNDKVKKSKIKGFKINNMFTIKQVLVDNPNFILSTRTMIFFSLSSDISTSTSITGRRSQNNVNFDRAVAERQKVKMCQSDQRALQFHFGNDVEALQKQRNDSNQVLC
jgi:hypothetical protein